MPLDRDEFCVAVEEDLGSGECSQGLQALRSQDRSRIRLRDGHEGRGSADIDAALKNAHPHEARWDYVIAHTSGVHFVEVHPAATSNVKEIKQKYEWLKIWLSVSRLGGLEPRNFHWVSSGKISITPHSNQYRQATKMGLVPKKNLEL